MRELPLVSVIMATYNRAHTIERAIDSVLNQTYKNFELLIVDDGSKDNTSEILSKYNDDRLRLFKHDKNKGVTAAKNLGLKNIRGQWFTTFDSDDEMVPEALETLINVPYTIDDKITAVSCNGWDTAKKCISGNGLHDDCYLDVSTLINVCEGDFWGITKSELLDGDLFNEKLNGLESILWFKINEKANSYYIHKVLLLIHTEGEDRLAIKSKYNFDDDVIYYENLIDETHFLDMLHKYKPNKYLKLCKNGLIVMRASKKNDLAQKYLQLIKAFNKNSYAVSYIYKYWIVSFMFVTCKKTKNTITDRFSRPPTIAATKLPSAKLVFF